MPSVPSVPSVSNGEFAFPFSMTPFGLGFPPMYGSVQNQQQNQQQYRNPNFNNMQFPCQRCWNCPCTKKDYQKDYQEPYQKPYHNRDVSRDNFQPVCCHEE
jgi:hypothetical protein